jgi:hypothetical protein
MVLTAAHHHPPIANCSPPPTNRQLLTTTHQSPTAHHHRSSAKCSPLTTNRQMLIAWMIRFDLFFFNSNHLLSKFLVSFAPFMFFISSTLSIVFFYDLHFSWVGAGRPCALCSCGFNRQVTDPIFPLCFSFYPRRLSWVGAGRPCAFRRRGFNRHLTANLQMLSTTHQPPTAHRLDDSFRFVFLQFDSLAFKILYVLSTFYVFHFINTFHRVFFYDLHLPWVGAGRPCALRSRGFNRQVTDPIFPLWFSSHFLHFSRVDAG